MCQSMKQLGQLPRPQQQAGQLTLSPFQYCFSSIPLFLLWTRDFYPSAEVCRLDRFGMTECKPVCSPVTAGCKLPKNDKSSSVNSTVFKQIVCSLMYLHATRPDVMFGVSMISRFMEQPTMEHLAAAKRVLRYLKGAADMGIMYNRGSNQ